MNLEELEKDCDVAFTRTGGPGGQHRNKAETAVRVTHRPTGIVVVAADHRSQYQNRMAALRRLADRLKERERARLAAERRRSRRRTKPTRASVERRLDTKRRRSLVKRLRKRIRGEGDGQ